LLCGAALVLGAPAAAAHADGDSATGGMTPPAAHDPAAPSGQMPVTAPRSALVGERIAVAGSSRRARRRVVRIERRVTGGTWAEAARARADRRGRFRAVWKPRRAGAYELRARVGGSSGGTGGTAVPVEVGAGSGSTHLTVYQAAIATWYGPGFFGRTTACGIELTEETVGVAHRRLPCGTQVQIIYRGRAIVVPVIDRGPFANDADWDLTQAAARQLGMTATSRIGAMPLSPGG
jgi:hypothetical protein